MEITLLAHKEMRSCYGDSQIEHIKSPLSLKAREKESEGEIE
jgi:hypothetical protein